MKNLFRKIWLRVRGVDDPKTRVSREQRERRLLTAERVQQEQRYGEWV